MKRLALILLPVLAAAGLITSRAHAAALAPAPDCALSSQGWISGGTDQLGNPLPVEPAGAHWLCSPGYTQDGLSRSYWVYEPTSWSPGDDWPLVVMLHGCTEQGPDIAYLTQLDRAAEARHFLVLYPNQAGYTMTGPTTFDGNGSMCWNWFLPQGQQRGSGEPALIAGATRQVRSALGADAARTYVIGVSAGAATADIMAATYPDLYAAVGVAAGCEYRGLSCFGSVTAVPPQASALLAHQASGAAARPVPFIVENGDADPVVPLQNGLFALQQLQLTNQLARGEAGLVPAAPCAHQTVAPTDGKHTPYDVFWYQPAGTCAPSDKVEGQLWVVHGEPHAWPGGPPVYVNTTTNQYEIYSYEPGPGFTDAALDFLLAHHCHVHAGVCQAGVA